jgi:hypothetical protein
MSLPDEAEIWWPDHRVKHIFSHLPNIKCGHFHVHNATFIDDVDCYSCLKLIEEGYIHNLPTKAEREAQRLKSIGGQNGYCSCGEPFIIKRNHTTKEQFFGCNNYPSCRKTKSLPLSK